MTYPDIIVSGAGSTNFNGTYFHNDVFFRGKPRYQDSLYGWMYNVIAWAGTRWVICALNDLGEQVYAYYSYDDVATPDLCTTWQKDYGTPPVPTVEADAPAGHEIDIGTLTAKATVTNVGISQTHSIDIGNLTAKARISTVDIAQTHNLDVQDLTAKARLTGVGIIHTHAIDVQSLQGKGRLTDVGIVQTHEISPQSLKASARVTDIGILQTYTIDIAKLRARARVSDIGIIQTHEISVLDLTAKARLTDVGIEQVYYRANTARADGCFVER